MDRFWSKVDKTGKCWNWTGYINDQDGYGQFSLPYEPGQPRKKVKAQRYAYILTYGDPGDQRVKQTCGNKKCCRPDHLTLKVGRRDWSGFALSDGDLDKFWSRVQKSDDCWEWTGGVDRGYGLFTTQRRTTSAHRWAWYMEHGSFPARFLCHRCDNPKCVRVEHLFEGTGTQNSRDMLTKGRGSATFLTDEQVLTARKRKKAGETVRSIHRDFSHVNYSSLCQAINGTTYAHLPRF